MEEQGAPTPGLPGMSGLDRIESGIPMNYELPTPSPPARATPLGRFGRALRGNPETVHEDGQAGAWEDHGAILGGGGGISGGALAAAAARWNQQSAPPEWLIALVSRLAVPWGPSRHAAAWTLPPGVVLRAVTGGKRGCTLAHTGLGADTGLNRAFLWLAWNQVCWFGVFGCG